MFASRLESLAYRMLGSVADAEDVVQEARLKLLKASEAPENEEAWLFRVVTNLALDRLRERKRREASYTGPWLPEPMLTESGPDDVAELAENLSLGLLFMLERLSPAERAVFVLREAFDLSFDDIGAVLNVNAAACRQRLRRARAQLAGEVPRRQREQDAAEQQRLLEALFGAVAGRDLDALVHLFAEDAVVYSDGGGQVSAAIIPVTDPDRIARVIMHIGTRVLEDGNVEFRWVTLNGDPAVIISAEGSLVSTLQVEVLDGRIQRLFMVRNPDKLAHLVALQN